MEPQSTLLNKGELSDFILSGDIYWNEKKNRVLFGLGKEYSFILSTGHLIVIPEGFITDFRSAPNPADKKTVSGKILAWIAQRIVETFVAQIGKHNKATLIHDYLYVEQYSITGGLDWKRDRKFADKEMLYWLIQSGCSKIKSYTMYYAVRIGGRSWWLNE